MDGLELLNNLNENKDYSLSFDVKHLFKFPLAVVLFGNILYALLVVLKVRILSDTFESTDKNKIKSLAYLYLAVIVVGSLLSLLFIILG